MTRYYLDILAETIRNNWNQPALTDFYLTEDGSAQDTSRGKAYTYGEMYAEIYRVADLLTRLGLQPSDHIAICGANSAHWVIAYLAIAKMQGVSVTIMHSLQPDEIARLVDFSDAKALFVDADIWEELNEESLPQIQCVIALEDWTILKGEKISLPIREKSEIGFPQSEPNSLAMICFTSGTTSRPKGVMLSYSRISNLTNLEYIPIHYDTRNTIILFLPLAHDFGLEIGCLLPLTNNTHIYIFRDYLVNFRMYNAIEIIQPKVLTIIPQMLSSLYATKGLTFYEALEKNDVQVAMSGAKIDAKLETQCCNYAFPLSIVYGGTEMGFVSISPYKQHKIGSCGKIIKNVSIALENGEILVKGENVMLGYYNDTEATAQKIDTDGWLHTGDKGHLDADGYLYVEGRLEQDIIVLPNGEKIRPDNIERLIDAMPEVKESIVIAREGKLIAIVVPTDKEISNIQSPMSNGAALCFNILHQINPLLPLYSQLDKVELSDSPLARTEKQTLKRYLYK